MRRPAEATLARKLNEFGAQVLSRYPHINAGGCCVFAALIAAKLAKIVPTQIRVEGYSSAHETNIDHIRPKMANEGNDWGDHRVFFNHVIVTYEVNGRMWYYDARGAMRENYNPLCRESASREKNLRCLFQGSLTISEASTLASESRRWNNSFDRADISDLIEMVDNFFETEFNIH